nr:hypothetical protein [uncultured Chryseobacterium sp.]
MKTLYFSVFILLFTDFDAQNKMYGEYTNGLGEKLILKPDHTFEYYWNFDLASSWNIGTWKVENNKHLLLKVNEVKDTVRSDNKTEQVLSSDQLSNEITDTENILNLISGGGQSRKHIPYRLMIKKNKLFPFSDSGKVKNKKVKSLMNSEMMMEQWLKK